MTQAPVRVVKYRVVSTPQSTKLFRKKSIVSELCAGFCKLVSLAHPVRCIVGVQGGLPSIAGAILGRLSYLRFQRRQPCWGIALRFRFI